MSFLHLNFIGGLSNSLYVFITESQTKPKSTYFFVATEQIEPVDIRIIGSQCLHIYIYFFF